MKKVITSFCALVCLTATLCAQNPNITVTDALGQSPAAFLKNHLFSGQGVYIFNVKHQNSASNISTENIGTFEANDFDGLGMTDGIIMTSGNISVAPGPNDATGKGASISPAPVDFEMLSMATNSMGQCSWIDFDFVCLADHITFNYCFGSEEYYSGNISSYSSTFVCSNFNDIFAFLLTGPDPDSGEEVVRNIAMIPGTISDDNPNGIPVTVNSVNDGIKSHWSSGGKGCYTEYSMYYVDNSTLTDEGNYPDGVQYNGYTSKLYAEAKVVPCALYHMHLSICDLGDQAYNSGVFIEGGSFYVDLEETGLSRFGVDTVHGSCPYVVNVDLSKASFDAGVVNFTYGGTAQYGKDYIMFDENGNEIGESDFVMGATPRTFTIQTLKDANLSTAKTIELCLQTNFCENFPQLIVNDTQRFVIVKGGDVKLRDTTLNCSKGCFEVTAPLVYGENVSYVWQNLDGTLATGVDNPYALTSTAMIFENTTLRLIATGGSGCNSDTATVKIVINSKDVPVAVDEAEVAVASVFPNPAAEVINVEANGLLRIEIFTVEGRLVVDNQYNNVSGTVAIPTEGFDNGVYGVRVTTANGKTGAKIVVNK